jgi:Flp pilus assembly protein TadG
MHRFMQRRLAREGSASSGIVELAPSSLDRAAAERTRARRRTRGQSLVELALITPVLALLFLATIDLGRLFYSQITVTNSAREGALEAAASPTSFLAGTCDTDNSRVVCAAVNEARNSFVTISESDVTLTCTPGCTKTYGVKATVTVSGHFRLLTPLMSAFTGGEDVTLTSTATSDVIIRPVPIASPTPTPSGTPTPSPTPTPAGTPSTTPTPDPSPTPVCPAPFANFTYTQLNKNKPVVFTSTSTPTTGSCGILYWRWDFGDGNLSTGNPTTASHTFLTKGGTYTVGLTVTVPGGITTTTYVTLTTKG